MVNIGEKMKKIILMLSMLLFSVVSYADTITILNNGKAGGSYNARTKLYKDGLEARGFTVIYENIGKISQAVKIFKSTDKPTIMVFSNNMVHRQGLFHNPENFIMLEYEQPMYICTKNSSKGKQGQLTVAHGKGYDVKLLKRILGDKIVLVPYKNSGAMLKGILGDDVDMIYNNQGKSLKYIASGHGTCEVSNTLPINYATVIGTNIDLNSIREIIFDISNDPQFKTYHETRKLIRPSSTWAKELGLVRKGEKNWQ
jgi:hypothetical protein